MIPYDLEMDIIVFIYLILANRPPGACLSQYYYIRPRYLSALLSSLIVALFEILLILR